MQRQTETESAHSGETPGVVLALVSDMIFATKISTTARALGRDVVVLSSIDRLDALISQKHPPLLLIDLDSMGDDAMRAIQIARNHATKPRVVAFVSHVNVGLADRARDAGATSVMPRSKFTNDLPQILTLP